ncbi:MAG TPA: alpha/beta fold hydrolase [Acidiferrobacteraceae bacterium]|nr:alpha/beta fold hydrolase [Acidiferrobacteraceae bacterium]
MTVPEHDNAFELLRAPCLRLRGRFEDRGGPVGVFLHGFRSDSRGFKASAFRNWAEERQRSWLSFDLRGHGLSDGAFASLRLTTLLADVEAVLEWLAPRPVVLVGSSLGGWLSVLAARRRPEQVAGQLLIAPAFNFIQQYFGRLPEPLLAWWRAVGTHCFPDPYGGPGYALEYALLEDAERHDAWQPAPCFHGPVAIVHGTADEAVPFAQSEAYCAALTAPAKRLVPVPGGDHRLAGGLEALQDSLDWVWDRRAVPISQAPRPGA